MPIVTTRNPNITNIFSVIKSNLPILYNSPKMKQLIKPFDIIHSRRQPKNLKQIFTKAKFES